MRPISLRPPVRFAELKCLACEHLLSGATGTTGVRFPSPGDLSICGYCGALAQYATPTTTPTVEEVVANDVLLQLVPFDESQLDAEDRAHIEKLRVSIKLINGS